MLRLSWERRADFTSLQGGAHNLRGERDDAFATTQGFVMKPSNIAVRMEPAGLTAEQPPPDTVPRLTLEVLMAREPAPVRRPRRSAFGQRSIVIRDQGFAPFRVR
jgi:hypothetical protein